MNTFKPILCLDFDGVIHSYEKGWQNGKIYGRVTPGFCSWAQKAKEDFKLVIYSSRSKTEEGKVAMYDWLVAEIFVWAEEQVEGSTLSASDFEFASEKPPAWLTIDDRAICFQGSWATPTLSSAAMLAFKPWMLRDAPA